MICFPFGPLEDELIIYGDANFAGCPRTRKSTAGGAITWGGSCIKTWSKTMATLALSSGESELAACSRAAAEGLGMQSILADFRVSVKVRIKSDATAAIGMVKREGLGRVRHLATADLWLQQQVRRGKLAVEKVDGTENPSDLLTKTLEAETLDHHMGNLMSYPIEGRHELTPKLDAGTMR